MQAECSKTIETIDSSITNNDKHTNEEYEVACELARLSLTEDITPQKLDNLKAALLHVEGTQEIDPPKTPQVVESIKINEFAKVLTQLKY